MSPFIFLFQRKASLSKLAFLFFFVFGFSAKTATPIKKDLSTEDIAAKVEEFVAAKKKNEAVQFLATEIATSLRNKSSSGKKSKKAEALLEQYELYLKLSRAFDTEKAQQIYEMAMASKKTNLPLALQKIDEALEVEPKQQQLLAEKARLMLTKKDCQGAQDLLNPLRERLFFDEEIALLLLEQQLCAQKPVEALLLQYKKQIPLIKYEWLWLSVSIQQKIMLKHWSLAFEEIERLKKVEENYPESHDYEWVVSNQMKVFRVSAAQKYLSRCEGMTGFVFRRYHWDPLLCQRTAEVTEDLKNLKKKPNG